MKYEIDVEKPKEEVTIFCDLGGSVHRELVEKFSKKNFVIHAIDSGRQAPTVEFKGDFFSGTKNILIHFFPEV